MSTVARFCMVFLASALLVIAVGQDAMASPEDELVVAREEFAKGKFARAIPLLSGLLYPTSRLATAEKLAETHLLLGLSYFETKKIDSAKREFEEALFLDATLSLDSGVFSVDAEAFFREVKQRLQQRAQDAEEKAQLAREKDRLRQQLDNLVVLEKRRYFVNFIPFGAGQFQNGQRNKGAFFFVSQAIVGGSSAVLWGYQVLRYGLSGRVPADEVDQVRAIQFAQVSTGAVFLGLMAWGIVDSLAHFEHVIQRTPDRSILEELELTKKQDSFKSSVYVAPLVAPHRAGLSLGWEF